MVCQDWGGPIGLRNLVTMTERFDRVLVSNTLLPNCEVPPLGIPGWPSSLISGWIDFTASADDVPVGQIIQGVTNTVLSDEVMAAYDAPFPDTCYKQGVMQWPSLIPITEHCAGVKENRETWEQLEKFEKPFLTAFSDSDPTTIDWEAVFQQRVKGAQGIEHQKIANAGHMVQEDQGAALAAIILNFIASYQA